MLMVYVDSQTHQPRMVTNEEFKGMKLAPNSLESAIRQRLRSDGSLATFSLDEVAWVAGTNPDRKKVKDILDRLVESGLVVCKIGDQPYYQWVW